MKPLSHENCVGSLTIASSLDRAIQKTFPSLSNKIEDHALIIKEIEVYTLEVEKRLEEGISLMLERLKMLPFIAQAEKIDSTKEVLAFEIEFSIGNFDESAFKATLESWYSHFSDLPVDMTLQFSDGHRSLDKDFIIKHQCSDQTLSEIVNLAYQRAKEIEDNFFSQLSFGDKIKNFIVGASSSLVFGFIDNGVMFIGGEMLDQKIQSLGFDSMTAAGFGNTISDMVGVACGGIVFQFLQKTLGVKGDGTLVQQLVGITVGCLIPVGIKMLTMMN